ncbi:phosphotransferase [Methylophaga frappieri]|uniref:Phosphotransferase n=1 Tax=Methylophaga frappieri (strain ATCC BAA-2434 / DSM 25690 / JAM7) TaxID=754477 RepID=I1YLJ1_METFJ|nr:phosphotransferase [Methylophaga frappieri]AFJ03784.1 phosphotransferase [Methylophaga frappieri]
MSNTTRYQLMLKWLQLFYKGNNFQISVASNDASFRRYFRLKVANGSKIIMDAPPEHEDVRPFVTIARLLSRHDVPVPHIYAEDAQQGFLLLDDFGTTPYLDILTADSADRLYHQAIDQIIQMQAIAQPPDIPLYDASLLMRELTLFDEWFLERHLQLKPPALLQKLYPLLLDNALSEPQCFVHRDYHSRNLMQLSDGSVGIIDFQDAVWGPASYDLVSLLKDAYIQWPAHKITQWLRYYYERSNHHNVTFTDFDNFKKSFEFMGLQRHLKVLGIFCRLHYRDNKSQYLNDLKVVLNYVTEVCSRYPELQPLAAFLDENKIEQRV